MAAVTQCDACGNVVKNEESKYIKIRQCTKDGELGNKLHGIDICPECYSKVCKVLNMEAKKK